MLSKDPHPHILLGSVVLAWWWVKPFEHNGLALALSASSFVNAVGLFWWMRKKLGPLGWKSFSKVILQTSVAAAVMGFVVWYPQHQGWLLQAESSLLLQAGHLLLLLVVGKLVFFGIAKALGCSEVKEIFSILRKRIR